MTKMENTTLVSGLVGAVVSSFFSFWIRSHLDRKASIENSNKLSYVYFVNLSNLVAFYEFSKKFIDIYTPKSIKERLKSQDNTWAPLKTS